MNSVEVGEVDEVDDKGIENRVKKKDSIMVGGVDNVECKWI
jgi:hypothetical protein